MATIEGSRHAFRFRPALAPVRNWEPGGVCSVFVEQNHLPHRPPPPPPLFTGRFYPRESILAGSSFSFCKQILDSFYKMAHRSADNEVVIQTQGIIIWPGFQVGAHKPGLVLYSDASGAVRM